MAIKQSIVIVNEFTYKPNGSSGTRGSSPGAYVTRYMARDKATEDLSPVVMLDAGRYDVPGRDQSEFIEKYMLREEAIDRAPDIRSVRKAVADGDRYSGVAFGYGSVALSRKQLLAASQDIQKLFDQGKTVMKTVVSFDEDYLKENGIVDEDFQFRRRGDYRGNIDQLKLRQAVMAGCDRLGRFYDDLRYVGVIQVDTAHVHCHLAMVDAGTGTLTPDGYQRGKISAAGKQAMRRGIDMSLEGTQSIKSLQSNVAYDRRHALCYVKKFTHRTMEEHGVSQFLMACLPEDQSMWRAGCNDKAMRKPNAIVREYVTEVLAQPDSGYREALQAVDKYCRHRQEREGFSQADYRKMYRRGQERVVKDCMNGVYSVLKSVPASERTVRTPMMEVMAQDYEQMAADAPSDKMIEFGFRLRSYSGRLKHHKQETRRFREAVKDYNATPDPDPASEPLLRYLEFERQYNAMLMCKYQHFLGFLPPSAKFDEGFDRLVEQRRRMRSLREMTQDEELMKMSGAGAERKGMDKYGHQGGSLVASNPDVLEQRLERMRAVYGQMEDDFRDELAEEGLTLTEDEAGLHVSTEKPYAFDDVKALDVHHLGYDFAYDVMVSKRNVDSFVEAADMRYELYQDAMDYLRASGQEEAVDSFPGRDVQVMKELADRMRSTGVLESDLKSAADGTKRRSRTFTLDRDFDTDMKLAVKMTVQSIRDLE